MALALALSAGCAREALRGADPDALQSATLIEACPLGVPETRVQTRDTEGGLVVYFSTRAANVPDLRRRVTDQAEVNGAARHRGQGHLGEHNGARNHGLRLWDLPPLQAAASETPSGAALTIQPLDPARRDEVRDAVRRRVAEMEKAGCR